MVGVSRAGRQGRGRGRGNLPGQVIPSGSRVSTRSSRPSNISSTSLLPTGATDIGNELCGVCNIVVGNDGIGCDQCSHWYHPTTQCTGLKSNTIACIQEEGGDTIRYVCSECRCQPRLHNQAGSANISAPGPELSQDAMGQLFEMVKSIAQSVALLTTKFESIVSSGVSNSLHNMPSAVTAGGTTRDSLFAEFHEFDERKKRKESVIVRGIVAANEAEFSTIFGRISSVILGRSVVPDNIVCINHQANLYRIKISDSDTRRNILMNAKNLKDDNNYKTVYLSRDLTFLQRQELRARRAASSRQNIGNGSNNNSNFEPIGNVQQQSLGVLPESGSDGLSTITPSQQNF